MSVLVLQVDEVMRTLSNDGQYPFVVNDKTVDIVRFALNTGFKDVVLDGQTVTIDGTIGTVTIVK